MKKVVLKLDILDERIKQKAMKNVSSLTGVDSISMDMKDKKLTVTGDVDPVTVVSKLRKICQTEIVSVGPAKEPEKKKDAGAGDKKKDDDKKKEEDKKKEAAKKKEEEALKAYAAAAAAYQHHQLQQQYPYYNNYQQQQQQQQGYYQYNHPPTPYYSKVVQDETPNCVIS